MAGRIPQQFIDELIARADIVEVINARVPLKKAGREFRACCPFHDEKTPSFWVSPTKQFFHCFGCGAHGTALGFLMQYEQLPFPEAVEELAGRLGMEVPHEAGTTPLPTQHEALHEMLARVAGFYEESLRSSERAGAYLRGRGLDAATIERFRIGYAPDAWNEVLRRFGATETSRQHLLDTGLIVARDTPRPGSEPWYDRFRDRVMFPIRDPRGRMLGFGGRILDRGEPKYLNSPETELFHKGRELYGLHEVRLSRIRLERLLVVEGYMDVVRLHQAGIQYAVATLGTATTPEHLRQVFKLVSEVVFAFDGDRAGRAAAWRALQNVLPEARAGREIRFLFLPDGEDPDSLVGREGRAAFEQRIAHAMPLSEYFLAHLAETVDLSHADGQARYIALARPLLARLPPGVYRELLIERLAEKVALHSERLRQLLEEPGAAPLRSDHTASVPRPARPTAPRIGRGGLITQAIQTLLHFPAAARAVPESLLTQLAGLDQPGLPVLRELLDELRSQTGGSTAAVLERWRERAESARLYELARAEILIEDEQSAAHELIQALQRMTGLDLQKRRLAELTGKQGDLTTEEKLEIQSLMSTLRNINGRPISKSS